jgi:hypothetical protein
MALYRFRWPLTYNYMQMAQPYFKEQELFFDYRRTPLRISAILGASVFSSVPRDWIPLNAPYASPLITMHTSLQAMLPLEFLQYI